MLRRGLIVLLLSFGSFGAQAANLDLEIPVSPNLEKMEFLLKEPFFLVLAAQAQGVDLRNFSLSAPRPGVLKVQRRIPGGFKWAEMEFLRADKRHYFYQGKLELEMVVDLPTLAVQMELDATNADQGKALLHILSPAPIPASVVEKMKSFIAHRAPVELQERIWKYLVSKKADGRSPDPLQQAILLDAYNSSQNLPLGLDAGNLETRSPKAQILSFLSLAFWILGVPFIWFLILRRRIRSKGA